MLAHTFRGTTWRSLIGLETSRDTFRRYREIRAREREYLTGRTRWRRTAPQSESTGADQHAPPLGWQSAVKPATLPNCPNLALVAMSA